MRKQFMPKTKGRRIMAMFLSICMVFTLSPAMVFADEKWEKTEAGSMYTYEQGSLADETKECSELDESDGTDETDEFDEIDGANKIDETNETDELDENDGTDETGAFDETNGKKETSEF